MNIYKNIYKGTDHGLCDYYEKLCPLLFHTEGRAHSIRKNSCGLRYQLYLSQHMHRCEQSHGIVGEGFKNLVVVVKTERFFVQNI